MTTYQANLIDILDRKYDLLVRAPADDFRIELVAFMNFILTNEHLKPYVDRMLREFDEWRESYKPLLLEEVREAQQIRDDIAREFPEIDDSDTPRPTVNDSAPVSSYFESPYLESLAAFDYVVDQVMQAGPASWHYSSAMPTTDETEVATLKNILAHKIGDIPNGEMKGTYLNRLSNLDDRHRYLRNDFYIQSSVLAPVALCRLLELKESVNRPPRPFATFSERTKAHVAAVPQANVQRRINRDEHIRDVRRVYEQLRADIGTQLAHYELVQRYKMRCMFYDRAGMTALVEKPGQKTEDELTQDLARFLFDNGVSTLYRSMRGVHEYDLLAPTIAVEAKQYKTNDRRKYLINGISQFHSYVNGLEADATQSIKELYYVIFRIAGPLYDWPSKIEMNRWTIYPIIIDLAPSAKSGSRQSRIKPITLQEILSDSSGEEE